MYLTHLIDILIPWSLALLGLHMIALYWRRNKIGKSFIDPMVSSIYSMLSDAEECHEALDTAQWTLDNMDVYVDPKVYLKSIFTAIVMFAAIVSFYYCIATA